MAISEHDTVIFVDATCAGEESFAFTEIEPANEITFTTHTMSPASVLALCHELYRKSVRAYVLAIRGYEWEFVEGLSPMAGSNLENAFRFIRSRIGDLLGSEVRDEARACSVRFH